MNKQKIVRPYKVNIKDVKSTGGPYGGKEDSTNSVICKPLLQAEGLGGIGVSPLEPGMKTIVFSGEYEDDGTAEHYYGPFNEFYYVICGEFAMYYGKDASKMREEKSEKILLKPGDIGHWTPGWKYMAKNIGVVPGMYIYGMARVPGYESIKRRGFEEHVIHHIYPHLARK